MLNGGLGNVIINIVYVCASPVGQKRICLNNTLLPSLKKNLVYNFVLSASQVLIPLISIPFISRILDPEGVGRVSFIDSFTYYFITIAEFGIMVYGTRAIAREKDNPETLQKLVSELLLLHVISSSIALLIYCISVYFIWHEIRDFRLLLFSLSFLLVNFFACEWYFLGLEKFRYIALRTLTTRILGLISIFVLIDSQDDYYIYYGIIVLSAIANSVWNNIVLFKQLAINFVNVNWKRHIKPTAVTYMISLVYSITLLLDNVLLGLVSTTAAVGLYAFAMKIIKTLALLLTDTLLVLFPRVVSQIQLNQQQKLQYIITRSVQLIIFFAVPICVGLFMLSEELVRVFLGESFLPASIDIRILALLPLIKAYSLFLSKQILIANDQEKLFLKSLVIGSSSFVVLSLFLSSWMDDQGACIAIIIAELITLLFNYYYSRKTAMNIRIFDLKMFFHAITAALLFIPVIYVIKWQIDNDFLELILSATTGFMLYSFILLYVMKNEFARFVKATAFNFIQSKWRKQGD